MARPQTVTDEQIEHAAREVFLEHGPKAPVTMVAKRLGVSHAALFQRVGTKAELMRRALGPSESPFPAALREPPPTEFARRRLAVLLMELLATMRRIVPGLVVLRSAGIELEHELGADRVPPPVAVRQALTRWLTRAAQDGSLGMSSPRGVAEGLLGAIEARAFNAHLGGDSYAPKSDRAYVRVLLDGLLPE